MDLAFRLENIRLNRAGLIDGRFDLSRNRTLAAQAYQTVFDEAWRGHFPEHLGRAAEWIDRSPVRASLLAALEDWAVCTNDPNQREALMQVARDADPNAWRDRLRTPKNWGERAELEQLVRTVPSSERSVKLLTVLALRLRDSGGDGVGVLRRVQLMHPTDFWANYTLAYELRETEPGTAIGYYRAALAVRPGTTVLYHHLGMCLHKAGRTDEAIDTLRRATQIDSRFRGVYNDLGIMLEAKWRLDEAIEQYEQAIRVDPAYALSRYNLGRALIVRNRLDEAIDHLKRATEINPKWVDAQTELARALLLRGRRDEAMGHIRERSDSTPIRATR